MLRQILKGSITGICGLAVTALGARAAAQDPAPPQAQAPAPAAAANQSPSALGGIWKFNKELSSDTSKLQIQADNASPSAGASGRSRGGFGGGFGRGGGGSGGRPVASTEQGLQTRALLREMAEPPTQVTIVVAEDTTTFTDDQGAVRKFTTDGKKESIDLGTAKVDSVSKWDGGTLTVEMTGGYVKLTETYQLTVQGHALVVELKSVNSGSTRSSGSGTGAVPVKRIYDRSDAGGLPTSAPKPSRLQAFTPLLPQQLQEVAREFRPDRFRARDFVQLT
jgi:hypothetical protein